MPLSDVPLVLKSALKKELIGTPTVLHEDGTTTPPPMALFIDRQALRKNFTDCRKAFGDGKYQYVHLRDVNVFLHRVYRCFSPRCTAKPNFICTGILSIPCQI